MYELLGNLMNEFKIKELNVNGFVWCFKVFFCRLEKSFGVEIITVEI